jgi:hypothetical protein
MFPGPVVTGPDFIRVLRYSATFMDFSHKTVHVSLLFVFCGLTHSFLMRGENPGEVCFFVLWS